MKTFRVLAAALSALSAAPAAAVTSGDAQGCQADLAALQSTLMPFDGPVLPGSGDTDGVAGPIGRAVPTFADGRCWVESIRLGPDEPESYAQIVEIGPLSWRAEWLDDTRPMPPASLSLDIQRIRQRIAGNGGIEDEFDYMQLLVADLNPTSLELEFAYDRAAQQLEVTRLALWQGQLNGVEFSIGLTGADLAGILAGLGNEVPPLDKLSQISIREAELGLTNGGMFEGMTVAWLGLIYPALGETPEAAVKAAKRLARDQIAAMPAGLASDESRAALTAVVDAVPHPLGTLHLKLDAPDGLMPARIAATAVLVENPDWDSVAGLLDGTRIDAEWTPAPLPGRVVVPAN